MPLRGEKIHDALDRLVCIVGMQRAEAQVAGFREGDCRLHCFGIANLADQNNIGRLAQSVFKRRLKRVRVEPDLALSDDRLFVTMDKFDGVLNRDHMLFAFAVYFVQHGRERR